MSAQCNRVAVEDGHTESISVKLTKKVSADQIIRAWGEFRGAAQELNLPSAPKNPVQYLTAPRPAPTAL